MRATQQEIEAIVGRASKLILRFLQRRGTIIPPRRHTVRYIELNRLT